MTSNYYQATISAKAYFSFSFNDTNYSSIYTNKSTSSTDPAQQIFSFYNYFWFMLVMCLIGIVGNGGVVLAFKFDNSLFQNVGNILVANLSIADLCICLLSGPLYLIVAFALKNKHYEEIVTCQIMGGINVFMFCESLYSLALIGINRFVLVTKPQATLNRWFGSKMIWFWIFLSWIISLMLTLLPLIAHFDLGTFGYHSKFRGCLWSDTYRHTMISWGFIISMFCMIPSLMAASYCYYKIFRLVRKSKLRVNVGLHATGMIRRHLLSENIFAFGSKVTPDNITNTLTDPEPKINIAAITSQHANISNRNFTNIPTSTVLRRFRRDQKTNIFLLIFFVAFTLCWFPWNITVLLENIIHFPLWFFRLAPVLSITNSSINPFMYGLMNEKFRGPYLKLIQYTRRRR